MPFSLPQPKPAVVAATLHLPAAPEGAHHQQQQTRGSASRHQRLGKPAAACEGRARRGPSSQAPGAFGEFGEGGTEERG